MSLIDLTTQQAKALAHPIRRQIIEALGNETASSPVTLANGGETALPTIAYHFKVLADLGMVQVVDTRQRRGATEHIYDLTDAGRSLIA